MPHAVELEIAPSNCSIRVASLSLHFQLRKINFLRLEVDSGVSRNTDISRSQSFGRRQWSAISVWRAVDIQTLQSLDLGIRKLSKVFWLKWLRGGDSGCEELER